MGSASGPWGGNEEATMARTYRRNNLRLIREGHVDEFIDPHGYILYRGDRVDGIPAPTTIVVESHTASWYGLEGWWFKNIRKALERGQRRGILEYPASYYNDDNEAVRPRIMWREFKYINYRGVNIGPVVVIYTEEIIEEVAHECDLHHFF